MHWKRKSPNALRVRRQEPALGLVPGVSLTTTNKRCKGGQFILHAKALPGNPYDGHTLKEVIEETEALTGREIERVYVDKGYRGHDALKPYRVFKSGQKRGVHGQIKRELRQ